MYAMVALLSEGKYDVIISAPNRGKEMENLRPLRAELPAAWSDIPNAMRGFKNHSLHMLVLDEVLGLELSNFSRQLKLKPRIDDDHRVIVAMSNHLWFRGMETKEGGRSSDDQEKPSLNGERCKPAENAEEKSAEFVNRVCQVTLEAFWTQNVMEKNRLTTSSKG